jgi:hypothetical protein
MDAPSFSVTELEVGVQACNPEADGSVKLVGRRGEQFIDEAREGKRRGRARLSAVVVEVLEKSAEPMRLQIGDAVRSASPGRPKCQR